MSIRGYNKPGKYVYVSETFDRPHKAVGQINLWSQYSHGLLPGTFSTTTTDESRREYNENISSVNTPGFYTKKQVRVEWKPKRFPLVPPSVPRLIITPLPTYVKRSDLSARSQKKAYEKYLRRYASIVQKRRAQIAKYDQLSAKYTKRLAKYNELVNLQKNGKLVYRKVRVSKADLQMNPYSREQVYLSGVTGSLVYAHTCASDWSETAAPGPYILNRIGHFYSGFGSGTFGVAPSNLVTSCDNRLNRKLFKQLNEQKVHVGNLIAERAQTFSMMKDIISRIIALKRNPFGFVKNLGLAKSSRQVADDLLAFKFGVEPLIKDFYGTLESLSRLTSDQKTDQIIIRCTSTQSDSSFTTSAPDSFGTVSKYSVYQTVKISYTIHYRIVNAALSELQSFGVLNPAEILWEVTPWSFVVDWFLPIGDYINSLSASAGIEFVKGTKTIVTTTTYQTHTYNGGTRSGAGDSWQCFADLKALKTVKTKVRTVLSNAPTPRLPEFKSPISAWHIAESLALLRQRLK